MGTSAAEAPERVRLQARRRELQGLLAAKNEELYELCVRELALAARGPAPAPAPAPASPAAPAPGPPRRRPHPPPPQALRTHHHQLLYSPDRNLTRVHETHFSSSHPNITANYSNVSVSSQPGPPFAPDTPLLFQLASQLKALSPHMSGLPQIVPNTCRKRETSRRNTLQRTQTYHLTSHSDYNSHHIEDVSASAQQLYVNTQLRSRPPQESQHSAVIMRRRRCDRFPSPSNSNYQISPISSVPPSISRSQQMSFGNSTASIYSEQSQDLHDRVKEKEWYESSLDSPSDANCAINLSTESYGSAKKTPLVRSPSVSQSRSVQDDLNSNVGCSPTPSAADNAGATTSPRPQHPPPGNVPFESPQNCTVVETGKWIPYREESKPFEMSDFYKYSTKYRQNNNSGPKQQPTVSHNRPSPDHHHHAQAEDSQSYASREHWKRVHQL